MPIQTKVINLASIVVILSSAMAGSKFTQFKILRKINEKYVFDINDTFSDVKKDWRSKVISLRSEVEGMKRMIKILENSENDRVSMKIEEEKKFLQESSRKIVQNKIKELDESMLSYQSKLQEKLNTTESVLNTLSIQIQDQNIGKEKQMKLEKISLMIIEDNLGNKFKNCYALISLNNEFKHLIPLVRQYYLMNYEKINLFKYFMSANLARFMFSNSPMQNFDVLTELNNCVERGDIHKSLFLFNQLKGWPRLILKQWAEKCRLRLELIQEIEAQLYLNKI